MPVPVPLTYANSDAACTSTVTVRDAPAGILFRRPCSAQYDTLSRVTLADQISRRGLFALLMACNTSAGTGQLSGGWSATIGGRTVGGGWTAEPHEEPDAAWGTWSLLDRSGGRLASGTWGLGWLRLRRLDRRTARQPGTDWAWAPPALPRPRRPSRPPLPHAQVPSVAPPL